MKIEIRKILCPVDFSASGDYAFAYAVAIAERHGATVELLHVTEPSAYAEERPAAGEEGGPTSEESLRERLRTMAASGGSEVTVETNLVAGVPYVEIVNRAGTLPADLIVLGTHGLTGLKHLLIGSVAEKVVRTASCPVCTIRHPDMVLTPGDGALG